MNKDQQLIWEAYLTEARIGIDYVDALQEVGLTGKIGSTNRIDIEDINHTLEYRHSDGKWRHFPNNTLGHEVIGKMYSDWYPFDELKDYFRGFNSKEGK